MYVEPSDEISLVDLAHVIWRHRRPAAATLLAVVVLGALVAFLLPRKYAYTTIVEIGSRIEDGKTVPIEAPDTVLAKLAEGYVEQARYRYADAHPQDAGVFKIEARVPQNSQLAVIRGTGAAADSAAYVQIQQEAVKALVVDHARVSDTVKRGIEIERQQAERDLHALADQHLALTRELERTKTTEQILERQVAETRALIDADTQNRSRAVAEARDEAKAMTLLMLDSEIRANRARLAGLEQDLQVKLAATRDDLQNQLLANQRDQELKKAQIERLALELKNLRETRPLTLGERSLRPVGLGRGTIVLLSVMLGALLALLVPMVLAFIGRVRDGLDAVSGERTGDRDSAPARP